MSTRDPLPPAVYECVVETALSPFCLVTPEGTVVWAGDSLSELLGWDPSEMVGANVLDFIHPASHDTVIESMATALVEPGVGAGARWASGGLLVTLVRADGTALHCDISAATPARTGLDHLVVQVRRAGTVQALHAAVAAMAHGREVGAVLVELAGMLEHDLADTAVEIAYGWDGTRFAQVCSGSIALIDEDTGGAGRRPWREALEAGEMVVLDRCEELPMPLRDRATAAGVTSVYARPVRVAEGDDWTAALVAWRRHPDTATAFSRQTLDHAADLVTLALQWHEGRKALRWAAEHDPLTGLANRRAFVQRLTSSAELPSSALLYLDLDEFKPINEEHGHVFGDKVLAVVGERLRGCLRPGDLVARIGGDEFAVLCPGLTASPALEDLVLRIIRVISQPVTVDGRTVQVGASVGVAFTDPATDLDVDALVEAADVQLREAKAARRAGG